MNHSLRAAQNSSVKASRAVLERIIHLHTDKSGQSEQTRQAAIRLERYPIEQLSGFLPKALLSENVIVTAYETSLDEVQRQLFDDEAIGHERIAKNHAQLIVLLRTLSGFLPIKEKRIAETEAFIVELAKERVQALEADNALVTEFWDMFDYLNQNAPNGVNHSNEKIFMRSTSIIWHKWLANTAKICPICQKLNRCLKWVKYVVLLGLKR